MFVKAKKILSSELMYALDLNEEEAAAWLENVLTRNGKKSSRSGSSKQEAVVASV